jgi:hypothetical protein
MPYKLHSSIRLGRRNRWALFNVKRLHTAIFMGSVVSLGFIMLAVKAFN